ncbi:MAG: efflux RND transporter periplasmic adaptor subunit [Enterobacterales bacterium]|nr:efflux RND transporter periplasmic adaptor subunit [Enterobacterales bacterium]
MKKPLVISLVLLLVIGFPLTKRYFSSDKAKQVNLEVLAFHPIKASILASGQLKHEQQVKLSAEVIGKVTKLFVKEGDYVVKGQLVLQIDAESYIAAVERQTAVVNQQKIAIEKQKLVITNLKQQVNRKKQLYKKKLLDEDGYQAIDNAYRVALVDLRGNFEVLKQVEASLEQARDKLSKTKVRSPIDGMITSLDIKAGETAISGTTNIMGSSLMTIADPASMLAEVMVDEADISQVALGQKAEIIAIAFSNKPIIGTVESIASSAKRNSGQQSLSFAIKLAISPQQELNLRPGMSCRAEIFTQGEQQKLALPIRAIKTEEDNDKDTIKNFVFISKDGHAEKIEVTLGIADDDFQEVISGLEKGTQVIVGPDKVLRHLKNAEPVEIINQKELDKTASQSFNADSSQ